MQVWTSHSGVEAAWIPGNGWSRVLPAFTTLSDLLSALDSAGMRGQVDALAIVAHGATMASSVPGEVRISPTLSAESIARASVAESVRRLGDFIRADGRLLFLSCRAGATDAGSELLMAISRLLSGREVKGYATYGYVGRGQSMAGNVQDTLRGSIPRTPPRGYPRMIEGCPSEKVARGGRIVRRPNIRRMWEQLEDVDPRLADRIREDWLRGRSSMVRRPPDPHFDPDWARPRTGYGYGYVPQAPEPTVEEFYASHYVDEW